MAGYTTSNQIISSEMSHKEAMTSFNLFLQSNFDLAKSLAITDPVISKDDEWNNPDYDNYCNITMIKYKRNMRKEKRRCSERE